MSSALAMRTSCRAIYCASGREERQLTLMVLTLRALVLGSMKQGGVTALIQLKCSLR